MPVVIDREHFGRWLDVSQPVEALTPLLRPSPADGMERFALSKRINFVKHDDPECLEPRAA
jgi:putative SOS response-associated peptidase YedK